MPHINCTQPFFYACRGNPNAALPLLFVHGGGSSHRFWLGQLEYCSQFTYALAVDLPGHGLTPGKPYTNLEAYNDFMLHVITQLGISSFILIGHSMGGAISLQFAWKHGSILKGTVVIGSGATLPMAAEIWHTRATIDYYSRMPELAYAPGTAAPVLAKAQQDWNRNDPDVYYADVQACSTFNLNSVLPMIQMPVLVIVGEGDQLTPPACADHLTKSIPNAQQVTIPEAGHMVPIEQRDAVNAAIKNFWEQIANKSDN